jgi:hypothetical protein
MPPQLLLDFDPAPAEPGKPARSRAHLADPDEAEIAAATATIRARWTAEEAARRAIGSPCGWTPPLVAATLIEQ